MIRKKVVIYLRLSKEDGKNVGATWSKIKKIEAKIVSIFC